MDEKHNVSVAMFHLDTKDECTERPTLAQGPGAGRKQTMEQDEDKLICNVSLEFQQHGTPLYRRCISEIAKALVE